MYYQLHKPFFLMGVGELHNESEVSGEQVDILSHSDAFNTLEIALQGFEGQKENNAMRHTATGTLYIL